MAVNCDVPGCLGEPEGDRFLCHIHWCQLSDSARYLAWSSTRLYSRGKLTLETLQLCRQRAVESILQTSGILRGEDAP